jgi:hypothetical protein
MINYKRFSNQQLISEYNRTMLSVASETHSFLMFRFGGISPDRLLEIEQSLKLHEDIILEIKKLFIKRGLSVAE